MHENINTNIQDMACEATSWFHVVHDPFQVLLNTVMNLRFPQNVENLISCCAFIISKGLRSAESEFPNNWMFWWSVYSKQITELLISSKIFLFLYFQGNVSSIIKCRIKSNSLRTAVNYLCVLCYHKYRLSTYIAPGWPWIHPSIASVCQEAYVMAASVFNKDWHSIRYTHKSSS
jgi:hypothetical protein